MTDESFERAKAIKSNLKLFQERRDKLQKIYNNVKNGELETDEILKIFNEYAELMNVTVSKQHDEFKNL